MCSTASAMSQFVVLKRRTHMKVPLTLALLALGCSDHRSLVPASPRVQSPQSDAGPVLHGTDANLEDAGASDATVVTGRTDDGNDEDEPDEAVQVPAYGVWKRVGAPPMQLQRICDLRPFAGALYSAHARQPLGIDGATIGRFEMKADTPIFRVAFDWNRPGEPSKGGGAGQGFLRIHHAQGRLFVPDADPPYAGFGVADWGTEGFVFLSNPEGTFAPPRAPHYRPPAYPTLERAGAAVLPRAYHVIDTIQYRGHVYASTGSVPPKERAWNGPSPGALHMARADLSRWEYALGYPVPYQAGVWRLTYMVRFQDKLLAGIQDYDGIDEHSYVVFAPPHDRDELRQEDARPMALPTANIEGGIMTLRWYADRGKLYWIGFARRGGGAKLRVSDDGETWKVIELPASAGKPTDIKRVGNTLLVLTERSLVSLDSDGNISHTFAAISDAKSPFVLDDFFCAAPLAVYNGAIYAGGQRDGALYRLETAPASLAPRP